MLAVEKQITRKIVEALIAADLRITVGYDHGYDTTLHGSTDVDAIITACDAVDECWLMIGENNDSYDSFIYFIWDNGNNGLDCISDYGMKLQPIMDPICKWIEDCELTLTEKAA